MKLICQFCHGMKFIRNPTPFFDKEKKCLYDEWHCVRCEAIVYRRHKNKARKLLYILALVIIYLIGNIVGIVIRHKFGW